MNTVPGEMTESLDTLNFTMINPSARDGFKFGRFKPKFTIRIQIDVRAERFTLFSTAESRFN